MLVLAAASLAPLSATATPPPPGHHAQPTSLVLDDRADALSPRRQELAERVSRDHRPTATPATVKPKTSSPARAKPQKRKRHAVAERPRVRKKTTRTHKARTSPPRRVNGSRASIVINFALAQVGKPYVFGADGPGSYDCSGLVKAAFARVGLSLPHQTGQLVHRGRKVSRAALQPGDIVFPDSGHVGIYLGRGKMVHASNPRTDIKVSTIYAFWTARRLL